MISRYWVFNHGLKFQNSVCDGCHELTMMCLTISHAVIATVKGVDYHCIIYELANLRQYNSRKIL